MEIDESLLEVREHEGSGYLPLIDYGAWRVAVLKYCDELTPENITNAQRHMETDEVFVLLQGKCILFVCEGQGDEIGAVHGADLEPGKLYNVKKAVWHNHTLSPDAAVLIVENRDTSGLNSESADLTVTRRTEVADCVRRLWNK